MRIDVFGKRVLSINEGPTEGVQSVAKARPGRIAGQQSGPPPLDLSQDPARNFKNLRGFRNIYLQGAYISEAVDLFPLYAIGNGYELKIDEDMAGDGEKAKKDVEEILTKMNCGNYWKN